MTYAHRPAIYDADSHVMEGLDWLRDHADAATRELLPDLTKVLDKGGAGAGKAIELGQARIADPVKTAALEEDVISSAKGWFALGAMDTAERTRALDLLGFTSQLVFSTFSLGLFAFADDLDVVYGGAAAHNRMMSEFCGDDDRMVGVGFLPLNDPDRSLLAIEEALELGCGAFWVAHAATGGRSPAHKENDRVWAAVQDAGVPIVLHIGGGKNGVAKPWHKNGHPRPVDLHGGGENLRAKDLPSVHHAAETYLTAMVLDGVFERFADLRCGIIEMGASWAPSLHGPPRLRGQELRPHRAAARRAHHEAVRLHPPPGALHPVPG